MDSNVEVGKEQYVCWVVTSAVHSSYVKMAGEVAKANTFVPMLQSEGAAPVAAPALKSNDEATML